MPSRSPHAAPALKVAIVHDWLVTYAGAEKVLEQIVALYPQADLFSLVDHLPAGQRGFIQDKPVRTSFIQGLPGSRAHYRSYLPLMPLAVEQFDLSGYDLVISSSYAIAKGVLTGPDQVHICYCHSPIRYAWDLQHQYLEESLLRRSVKGALARLLLHYIRLWDTRTSNSVDRFLANSQFVGRRIRKVYGREATVIHPPVDVAAFTRHDDKDDFYLTASRLVPYKRIDLIVAAFATMPERRLVVIGDGPEMARIRAIATPNVTLLGFASHATLVDHMQRARAFVFAAEEDFGIVPVEAQACGTPVIAFGKGGALETVRPLGGPAPTGVFFYAQTVEALAEAVDAFERDRSAITAAHCRANAEAFSVARFHEAFRAVVCEETTARVFFARGPMVLSPAA